MSSEVLITDADNTFKKPDPGACYCGPQRLPDLKIWSCSHCGKPFFNDDTAEVIWVTVNNQWVAGGVYHGKCHPNLRKSAIEAIEPRGHLHEMRDAYDSDARD